MPKEIFENATLPGVSAEQFFSLVYLDTNLLKRFHSEVNHDDGASVPRWAGDRRTLRFSTPLDAPALVRRLVGAEVVHVVEEQVLRRLPGGGVEIESKPEPQIPGASNFSSLATLALRDIPGGGGCRLEGRVLCAATGPYGLVSTLESFMADSAAKSLRAFIDFCQAHIQSLQQSGSMQAALGAAAAAAGAAAELAAAPAPEEFFEAEEPQLPVPLEPGTATLEVLALYLQYISRTGDQTVAVLSSMDARLAQLEAAAAAAASLQQQRSLWTQASSRQLLFAAGGAVTGALVTWLLCRRRT